MPSALIAEDEPLLAAALQSDLARLWPQLQVVAIAADGLSAAAQALALRPEVCLLDIRMPGASGLEAAQAIAEDWPQGEPFRCWSSSPPTTSTRWRRSRPRRWITWSSRWTCHAWPPASTA